MTTDQGGTSPDHSPMTDERPPILGSWRNLYAAVLLTLAAEVAIFYYFTRSFE